MIRTTKILGVSITSEGLDNILEYLIDQIKNQKKKIFIITPNPEMLVYASKHLDYKDKLNRADIALPDGIGLFFASGFIGKRLEERITGVDFIEKLCEVAQEKPLSIGFLGGRPGVAEQTAKCLLKKYPYLTIVFAGSEWDENRFTFKKNQGKGKNKNFSPLTSHHSLPIDILFVAYGVPKQEEWIYENLPKLPVKAAMGVGGSFDFLSGIVPRAPFIIRFAGFEWLFRLIVEPWRWKRQLSLIEFVILVFKERLA